MTERKHIEAAYRRRRGDPEAREALRDALRSYKDWRGTCRRCRVQIEGTLQEAMEHKCEAR